jgi:hypothetical protein
MIQTIFEEICDMFMYSNLAGNIWFDVQISTILKRQSGPFHSWYKPSVVDLKKKSSFFE